jgi:DNA-binding transcriptional LysR family regulator
MQAMQFCMVARRVALMLDWDDLRYFLAVAREGSLSAASRALGVAQPTVGRRLSAFERSLGAKLLVATPSGQQLSPTGRRLLAHAEQMEGEALAAERVARGRDTGLSGRVVLTASEWMIRSVLSPSIAPFVAAHPALELELLAEARHLSLVRREADLAIRPSAFEQQEIVQRELATIGFGLYASDAYLARHGAPDFERQCEGHALIAMSDSLSKIPDVSWLPRVAAKARVVLRTNGREPMASLAAAGVGITCLPRFLGDATIGLRLLSTPSAAPERQLWIGVHRDARAVPRLRACIAFLRDAIRRLQPALNPTAASV